MIRRKPTLVFIILLLACDLAFAWQTINIVDYGAKGDGKTKDTSAIHAAIAACETLGGCTVLFPRGTYLSGSINMTSNMILDLSSGAVLLGSEDESDYPTLPAFPSYGYGGDVPGPRYAPLIYAYQLTNITLSGGGEVDGQGKIWWERRKQHQINTTRPHLVEIEQCQDVLLQDLYLHDSPFWTLHPVYSDNVTIRRVRIVNPIVSPNTDGIDPDSCSNVLIDQCSIATGDDHIAIKSGVGWFGRNYNRPSVNITVQNSEFLYGAGVAIGSEMAGSVHNVLIRNCTFTGSFNVVRFKSVRGDGGTVSNITYAHHKMDGVLVAIDIDMFFRDRPPTNTSATPIFKDIYLMDIHGVAARAGQLDCLPESPCSNVVMTDVVVEAVEGFECQNVRGTERNVSPKMCFSTR